LSYFENSHKFSGLQGGRCSNGLLLLDDDDFNDIIIIFTVIGLSPGDSDYFTCKQNMKSVPNKFKSGGLHEKHVVATWNFGNHFSICL
jgi:hypothetical protein